MELMTKYQYTYFIYPYVIDSNKYSKYMQKLLKNKNCKLRIFETAKDMHLYNYFLPDIRESMFWSFGLEGRALKDFEKLDTSLKANLLAEHECNIFKYELAQDLQGKIGEKDGIFFDINKIKIVCFKKGICFLIFKTTLLESNNFSDILNFNYKFREINSKTYDLKAYENIKLQSDIFKDVKEISELIKEITGGFEKKRINLNDEKLITYSYCCLDQSSWNEDTNPEWKDNIFEKYREILPAGKQIDDLVENIMNDHIYDENKYIRYGFSNNAVVLLTSDINTSNCTILAQKYESEYLYNYILELYKKILLKKLSKDFDYTRNFKDIENEFLDFTKKLWIQEVTDDEIGRTLTKKWNSNLGTEDLFFKLKNKYDILYKKYNIEKTSDKNGKLVVTTVITIVIGIINLIILLWK